MTNSDLARIENKINQNMLKIKAIQQSRKADLELTSDLTKYACVLVSGYFEKSLYFILVSHCRVRVSSSLLRYISLSFIGITNLTMGKTLKTINKFDNNWENNIKANPRYLEYKAALDTLVSQRNRIAHGEDSQISLSILEGYFNSCKSFLNDLKRIIRQPEDH
jgi:hypothetical protein